MVTLVEETGAGLPDANTYCGLSRADAYYAAHPFYADAWEALPVDVRNVLLAAATSTLDGQYLWHGRRATAGQALDWPRCLVRDLYDQLLPHTELPQRLRSATAEMAYWLTKGDRSPEAQTSSQLDSLRLDVIELNFAAGSARTTAGTQPVPTVVRGLLRGLGVYQYGSRTRRVVVG